MLEVAIGRSTLNASPFEHCGIACISDLQTERCRQLLELLEQDQAVFLEKQSLFISADYIWPRDPLHTWSRVWEYPYVYHHLEQWRKLLSPERVPIVVDFGSGVTFFPFSVARLNCRVLCTDIDRACQESLEAAVGHISAHPGNVEFRLSSPDRLPLDDNLADCLYCISVLEHIADLEQAVAEVARVLRPGGFFVLTFDLDLRGEYEMSPQRYRKLLTTLGRFFDPAAPVRHFHPRDMLSSDKGPYALRPPQGWAYAKYWVKNKVIKPLIGRPQVPLIPYLLTVEGMVLTRRRHDNEGSDLHLMCLG